MKNRNYSLKYPILSKCKHKMPNKRNWANSVRTINDGTLYFFYSQNETITIYTLYLKNMTM